MTNSNRNQLPYGMVQLAEFLHTIRVARIHHSTILIFRVYATTNAVPDSARRYQDGEPSGISSAERWPIDLAFRKKTLCYEPK